MKRKPSDRSRTASVGDLTELAQLQVDDPLPLTVDVASHGPCADAQQIGGLFEA